jgi:hypothetical protein
VTVIQPTTAIILVHFKMKNVRYMITRLGLDTEELMKAAKVVDKESCKIS